MDYFDLIPNEVLEMILEEAGDVSCWLSIPLVCKRWHLLSEGVFNSRHLLSEGVSVFNSRCVYQRTCKHAAKTGNVKMLKWIAECKGVILDKDLSRVAAKHGHTEVLRWLVGHADFIDWEGNLFNYPSAKGDLEMVKFLGEVLLSNQT